MRGLPGRHVRPILTAAASAAIVALVMPATVLAGLQGVPAEANSPFPTEDSPFPSSPSSPSVPTGVVATINLNGVASGPTYVAAAAAVFLGVNQECDFCAEIQGSLEAINVTTNSVTVLPPVLNGAEAPVVDPATDSIYVAGAFSGNLSEYSASTGGFLRQFALEPHVGSRVRQVPNAPCYDPGNGDLYISFSSMVIGSPANLTVLAPSNGSLLVNVTLGPYSEAPVYDPVNGDVYVPFVNQSNAWFVAVVNGSSNRWIANVPVGTDADPPVVDTRTGLVYVAAVSGDNVTVLDGATTVATIDVGQGGTGGALYDPENDYVYLWGWDGGIWVLHGEDVLAELPGYVSGPGFHDPDDGFVYLPESSGEIVVLNGTSVESYIRDIGSPSGFALDPGTGDLYLATEGTIVEVLGPAPPPSLDFLGVPVPGGYLLGSIDLGLVAVAGVVTVPRFRRRADRQHS